MTCKLFLSLFIILQWLDEYYEIKPTKFTHRTGSIFKKELSYTYTHIMSIDLEQSFWGRLFNYGTIHMYDRYINKHLYLYLIHNPKRYYNILKSLIPVTDSENLITREHLIEEENNTV